MPPKPVRKVGSLIQFTRGFARQARSACKQAAGKRKGQPPGLACLAALSALSLYMNAGEGDDGASLCGTTEGLGRLEEGEDHDAVELRLERLRVHAFGEDAVVLDASV